MIVIDTSAVLSALILKPIDPDLVTRLAHDPDLHAPHLIDVEMIHALRRLVSSRKLSVSRAQEARIDFEDLTITRYPHHPHSDRMWELRENLTAYDAAFVALSEALDVSLITCDARLQRSGTHSATVEVFGLS